jgi:hypothetical protein
MLRLAIAAAVFLVRPTRQERYETIPQFGREEA